MTGTFKVHEGDKRFTLRTKLCTPRRWFGGERLRRGIDDRSRGMHGQGAGESVGLRSGEKELGSEGVGNMKERGVCCEWQDGPGDGKNRRRARVRQSAE